MWPPCVQCPLKRAAAYPAVVFVMVLSRDVQHIFEVRANISNNGLLLKFASHIQVHEKD